MCVDPVTLSVLGTVFGATSAIQESKAQAATYENQANAADQNSKVSAKQAEISAQNGAQEEREMKRKGAAMIGAQKTGFAANGIDSASGSAMDVINDTSTQNELDALAIRKSSANQVWNYQAEETNFKNQASSARSAAKNAKTTGMLKAATTVLTGASSFQSKYGKKGG